MTTQIPTVRLRPNHEHRVRDGHPWVFSNEIADDVSALPAGGTVDVFDAKGAFVGRGYANPKSLIAIRLLSRARKEDVDAPVFLTERLRRAFALREAVYPGRTALRVCHAEGDGLPGLVIDRYNDTYAVQITTLGMEVRKDAIRAALESFGAKSAVLRGDPRMREFEGLADDRGPWFGELPESIIVDELGVKFRVDPTGHQKTGHFFDQAENRRFAGRISKGRSVLDVYCNTGGFALHALAQGATKAVCVDIAAENIPRVFENAELNGFSNRIEAIEAEGRDYLEKLVAQGRRFGVVMLDPPAFAKSRKVASKALVGYRDVNALGAALCEEGGFLVTSSCSFHIEEDRFVASVAEGAKRAGKRLAIIHRGEQASDHPVVPGVPESRYLKHYVMQVTTGV